MRPASSAPQGGLVSKPASAVISGSGRDARRDLGYCTHWGGGFGPGVKTGCKYSQRCTLTRMLVKINSLPVCISSVPKEVIT